MTVEQLTEARIICAFSVEKKALLKPLARLQNVAERRNTIAILANIKLTLTDNQLELAATDMDIAVSEIIEVEGSQSGVTTVNAYTFYEIVRKLPDDVVKLKADGKNLSIDAGSCHFNLATIDAEQFPSIQTDDFVSQFALTAQEVIALLDKTRFAVSNEETRYYLNGIYLHTADGQEDPVLRTVATDGHRLASFEVPLPDGASTLPGVIVPQKAITELRKLCESDETHIQIALSASKAQFSCGNVVIITKLIDGSYPDYTQVIPKTNDITVMIDNKAFTEAIDRVSTVTSEKLREVKLAFSEGQVTISAHHVDNADAEELLSITYTGPEFVLSFNARYLLEVLDQIEGDKTQLSLSQDINAPIVILDSAAAGALFVVMPLRV